MRLDCRICGGDLELLPLLFGNPPHQHTKCPHCDGPGCHGKGSGPKDVCQTCKDLADSLKAA